MYLPIDTHIHGNTYREDIKQTRHNTIHKGHSGLVDIRETWGSGLKSLFYVYIYNVHH